MECNRLARSPRDDVARPHHEGLRSATICELLRFTRKRNPAALLRPINTTGKSPKSLSTPPRKNIPLNPSGKSVVRIRPSHPNEGRLAIVTDARWDAVDAKVATDERDSSGR